MVESAISLFYRNSGLKHRNSRVKSYGGRCQFCGRGKQNGTSQTRQTSALDCETTLTAQAGVTCILQNPRHLWVSDSRFTLQDLAMKGRMHMGDYMRTLRRRTIVLGFEGISTQRLVLMASGFGSLHCQEPQGINPQAQSKTHSASHTLRLQSPKPKFPTRPPTLGSNSAATVRKSLNWDSKTSLQTPSR